MSKKPLTDDNPGVTPGLPPLGEGLDDPTVRRRRGQNIKCFSHSIEVEPKEKWALLFNTLGSRCVVVHIKFNDFHSAKFIFSI